MPRFANRIIRSLLTLVIVSIAYTAYALVAVPLIEPPVNERAASRSTQHQRDMAGNVNLRFRSLLQTYFPEGHWVFQDPKILQSKQAMLLIQDYRPLDGGQVELKPCAMIFFPKPLEETNPPRDAVVMEAPNGAILQFEGGFNLSQAKIGKLQYGKLIGEIVIRSDMQEPGPQDDLKIVTHNVEINESRAWTEHLVHFRAGQNWGQGRQMEIRLLPTSGGSNSKTGGLNVGGIQSFKLSRDVKMHIVMNQDGLLPGEQKQPSSPQPSPPKKKPQPPVEVTCQGMFHFNVIKNIATFEDRVDILRLNPSGPSDQMNCELLTLYFQEKKTDAANSRKPANSQRKGAASAPLEPVRIVAEGEPVVVRSPSTEGNARCQRLEYDIASRKISLDGKQEVLLFQGQNEIRAPAVQYQPSTRPGGLGMLWASGPGWLRAASKEKPNQNFEVRWQEELHLRKHEGLDVISVLGRPELKMSEIGTLTSDEVHLWLRPAPSDPSQPAESGSPQVTADRLMAQGNVEIASKQLTGETERLEIWFKQAAATDTAWTDPNAGNHPDKEKQKSLLGFNGGADSSQRSSYDVRGKLVRLQVLMSGRETKISDVAVDGNVLLREKQAVAGKNQLPLVIQSDRLQLTGFDAGKSHVTIAGKPANVQARGLTLAGDVIELDQATNRMWIDGPGTTTFPLDRDLNGKPLDGPPQKLVVHWQGSMNFDGQQMDFRKQVVAKGETQRLETASLSVELSRKIAFAGDIQSEQTEVHQIQCRDGVNLLNRTTEEGKLVSIDRMQSRDLEINQTTGHLSAQGPGWLTTVRLAGSQPAVGNASLPGQAQRPQTNSRKENPLDYLRVDFAGGVEGNIKKREVHFIKEVRTVYGPVANWEQTLDPNSTAGLGERGILLNCDRLTIAEMKQPSSTRSFVELEARGEALIEGHTFTARAGRMAYTQAKELLVLEGTGGGDAQLWRQQYVGGPSTQAAARKILYWRDTNRVKVEDARLGEGIFTRPISKQR